MSDEGTECGACGHFACYHYNDVLGVVQCRWTQSGVTTRGVVGMAYTNVCQCHEYRPATDEDRRRFRREQSIRDYGFDWEERSAELGRAIGEAVKAGQIPASPGKEG